MMTMAAFHVAGEPLLPPNDIWKKWAFYRGRYGILHALVRFAGSRLPIIWKFAGKTVTQSYMRSQRAKLNPLILNLGGGGNCLSGCLTVDIDPRADAYVNICESLPFPEESIDFIFCEEVIEHISKERGIFLLQECFRILKRGGVMRITTPDLKWFSSALMKGEISCDFMNSIFYEHSHRYIYSPEELLEAVSACGFKVVKESKYKDRESILGFLDSHADRFSHDPRISQYLEVQRSS
jgi:predicted SAM-dependent methyltransferase